MPEFVEDDLGVLGVGDSAVAESDAPGEGAEERVVPDVSVSIHCELPISVAQAALGCDVEVPTLEGKRSIRVPAGTQSGDTLRLPGEGVPQLGGGPRGDQLVRIFVEVPTRLDKQQRELLEKFAEATGSDVSPATKSFMEKLRDLFG